MQWKE